MDRHYKKFIDFLKTVDDIDAKQKEYKKKVKKFIKKLDRSKKVGDKK